MAEWKTGIRSSVQHFDRLSLIDTDIGKLVCSLLYICEGAKYPSTRGLAFANSDPEIIACFLNLLRNNFGIEEKKLRCRVMYRCDQDIGELNSYWASVTKIPLCQFFKSAPDARTKDRPTLKATYKGVCSIQYSDTTLQFRLMAIGERIMKSGAGGDRTLEPLACHASALPIELQPLVF